MVGLHETGEDGKRKCQSKGLICGKQLDEKGGKRGGCII